MASTGLVAAALMVVVQGVLGDFVKKSESSDWLKIIECLSSSQKSVPFVITLPTFFLELAFFEGFLI